MSTTAILSDVQVFLHNARTTHQVLHLNVDGLSQQDSLVHPEPAGNCLNWVVGHLVNVYDQMLPMLGEKPVLGADATKRYERGSRPLVDSGEALDIATLMKAWDDALPRIEAGLSSLTAQQLDAKAPKSPSNNPNETIRTLLATVFFHQAYHAGQTGVLRRIAGKPGAIA